MKFAVTRGAMAVGVVACWIVTLLQPSHSFAPVNTNYSVHHSERSIAMGSPEFTLPELYNSYEHMGMPMGLLQKENPGLEMRIRRLSRNQSAYGDSLETANRLLFLPDVGFHNDNVFSAVLYYHSADESVTSLFPGEDSTADRFRMDFGLDLAFGAQSKLYQLGFSLHGSRALARNQDDAERLQLQLKDIGIGLLSQPHPWVRLGTALGASAFFDSLRNEPSGELDRYFVLGFPRYDVFVDFGDTTELPVLANAGWERQAERFLGVYRFSNNSTDYDRVVTTGTRFKAMAAYFHRWRELQIMPALQIGWSGQEHAFYAPGEEANDPYDLGEKRDKSYTARSLETGFGLRFVPWQYATVLTEWQRTGWNFDLDGSEEDEGHFRFTFGAEGNLHRLSFLRIPPQWMAFLRLGYTAGSVNSRDQGFGESSFQYFPAGFDANSQAFRLNPDAGSRVEFSQFSIGLGGGLAEGTFSADLHLGFYEAEPADGFELGMGLVARF